MNCPICKAPENKCVDSRSVASGKSIRRRRRCCSCGHKFTTYEIYAGGDGGKASLNDCSVTTGVVLNDLEKHQAELDALIKRIRSMRELEDK